MATLKQALTKAEDKAAKERTEREKHEAQVGEVRQELHVLVMKHKALDLDLKTRESELVAALESAKSAKAEAQKALQEIDAMKKIAAGKAFNMQSKHVKVNYVLLTRIQSSPGAFVDLLRMCPPPQHSSVLKRATRRRRCSGLRMLRPDTLCP